MVATATAHHMLYYIEGSLSLVYYHVRLQTGKEHLLPSAGAPASVIVIVYHWFQLFLRRPPRT